ncbi:hypothetical protein [Sulfobacillus thermosulfidooxidans]|uniref:hypothetical protein n=1 Tax=Sulfobacillus thermosulfidooxidans TaxID=28034 RepID=UPI00030E4130|nr:hypothetical protein [Sulfobacillus thermosulfidooxidans]
MAPPPVIRISAHAWQRWQERAPHDVRHHWDDCVLAAHTGRVLGRSGATRWVLGLGMILVIEHHTVVTCWRASARWLLDLKGEGEGQ